MASLTARRGLQTVIRPFGDESTLGKPLFLETGGSILLSATVDDSVCWSVLKLSDGRYEGATTKDGKIASQYGKYIFKESGERESYVAGKWNGKSPCGPAVRQYANGSVFHGVFHGTAAGDALPNGLGICTLASGDLIAGDWKDGELHGRGIQRMTSGESSMFAGDYVLGQRSGHGVYSFSDGSEYAGQFKADETHGYGSYRAGKNTYLGSWSQGKRDGWSIFTTQGGSEKWAGLWKEGRLEWSIGFQGRQGPAPGEVANKVRHCWKAAQLARAASDLALQLADSLCNPKGQLQKELEDARMAAAAAGEKAESAARKARALMPLEWSP